MDIGCNGRISDGGVFRECSLSKALEEKSLNIPAPSPLPAAMFFTPLAELLNAGVHHAIQRSVLEREKLSRIHFFGMSDSTYVGRHKK